MKKQKARKLVFELHNCEECPLRKPLFFEWEEGHSYFKEGFCRLIMREVKEKGIARDCTLPFFRPSILKKILRKLWKF